MILLLDTSTPVCRLTLVDRDERFEKDWQADRGLAKGLLKFIHEQLAAQGKDWADLTGLAGFKGPGSYTGLRIGLTVLNTLADGLHIPIVGETGDGWQETALGRLAAGENDKIVMPEYGGVANITTPRK